MTIYHWIGVAVFVLFCIAMIWQIESDMRDTQRIILKGYGFANATHSAQTFEKTGVALDTNVKYLMSPDKKSNRNKRSSEPPKSDDDSFSFDI